jgi:hypothetical protein
MTIMKSVRVSGPLLRLINKECKARQVGFSEFIRQAAVAWAKEQSRTGKAKAA